MLDSDMDRPLEWKRKAVYILCDGRKGTYIQALQEVLDSLKRQRREIEERIRVVEKELTTV